MQVAAVDLQMAGGGRPVTGKILQGLTNQLALKLIGSITQADAKCGAERKAGKKADGSCGGKKSDASCGAAKKKADASCGASKK